VPSTVQNGSVCEVPPSVTAQGTATAAANGAGSSTIVSSSPYPQRVVVSEPTDRPRLSWRRTDPDASVATTTVEGAVGESSVNR
jgi:hypothetical protein